MTAEDLPLLHVPLRVTEVPLREEHPPAGIPREEADHREVHLQEADLQEVLLREAHREEDRPLRSAATVAAVREAVLPGEERKEESVLHRAHIYSLRW